MDDQTKILIAAGAAVATNCQPCLQTIVEKAAEGGIDQREIDMAIEVGKMVKKGAASKMDEFIANMKGCAPDCGCRAQQSSDCPLGG